MLRQQPVLILPAQPIMTRRLKTQSPTQVPTGHHPAEETATVEIPRLLSHQDTPERELAQVPEAPAPVPSILWMAIVRKTHSNQYVPQSRNRPQESWIRYWQTEAVQLAENSDTWTFSWIIPSYGKVCSEHDYFCRVLTWATFCSRILRGAEVYIPRRDATTGGPAPARDSTLATTLDDHWHFSARSPGLPSLDLILEFALPAGVAAPGAG